ncbi:type II toxin-antitoxin system Phd/YefM family antitoxin [Candidatus Poriferisodalis sp.]|uniref:type II toxin-antitoxin system Phd/YefM family antitoxin n=1 Tax=Candidatus Poriferisodalis sp. TaxID=3101277 RepID=UPI003B010444
MAAEPLSTRTVSAAEFKTHCLRLMDEVRDTGIQIVVTKHGRPVSRLVPVERPQTGVLGAFPEFSGFWDDPAETVIDPAAVAALTGADDLDFD